MSQPTAQALRAPLHGHMPWYEAETQMTGVDPEGWTIWGLTGRAQAGCRCGQRIEWDDTDVVMASLTATCFAPASAPPAPTHGDH